MSTIYWLNDKLAPNENQNEEFVNQWYKIQDDCAKQLIKMTIKFYETAIKETTQG